MERKGWNDAKYYNTKNKIKKRTTGDGRIKNKFNHGILTAWA